MDLDLWRDVRDGRVRLSIADWENLSVVTIERFRGFAMGEAELQKMHDRIEEAKRRARGR